MEQLFNEDAPDVAIDALDAATPEKDGAGDAKFGDQMNQLESIVSQLESGQLDLEDSLKRYEEGVALIRSLQTKLDTAEQKVQVMMGEIIPSDQ
ncbi:MAG: exodeoxyribonuclease VII small subunit [Coriobacteriia bacterium]|nr:exodeoxyribonuclease VII small subunit [Coriobacteriia bacterium]MCL2537580.1 exodeoxyribonuclease VII small subunit [Coriobacteriia bacterium]